MEREEEDRQEEGGTTSCRGEKEEEDSICKLVFCNNTYCLLWIPLQCIVIIIILQVRDISHKQY